MQLSKITNRTEINFLRQPTGRFMSLARRGLMDWCRGLHIARQASPSDRFTNTGKVNPAVKAELERGAGRRFNHNK